MKRILIKKLLVSTISLTMLFNMSFTPALARNDVHNPTESENLQGDCVCTTLCIDDLINYDCSVCAGVNVDLRNKCTGKVSLLTLENASLDTWAKHTIPFDEVISDTPDSPGKTVNNPIKIKNAGQLAYLAAVINSRNSEDSFYEKLYYRLDADIDLSDYLWIPIAEDMGGGSFQIFGGCFDGNNKTITGLKVDQTATGYAAGLFGNVVGNGVCSIKDLTVNGAIIKSSGDNGTAGILLGKSIGSSLFSGYATVITNCTVSGEVTSDKKVGGFVGESSWASFENCTANVTINGSNICGGFVGTTFNSLYKQCKTSGKLDGGWSLGGFAGIAQGNETKISHCTANVDITASNWNIGGFVGYLELGALIENSAAYGDIDSMVTGWWAKTGGFAGTNNTGIIKKSYASGTVASDDTSSNPVAGFIGNSFNGTTEACQYDKEKNPTLVASYSESGNPPGKNDIIGDTTIKIFSGICVYVLDGHQITGKDWISVDANNHKILCTVCNDVAMIEAHTPSTDDDDCTTAITCSKCNSETAPGNPQHTLSNWQSDEINHWKKCINKDCTHTESSIAHTPNIEDGDCTTAVTCSVCGFETTAAKTHNWNLVWTSDGTNHWNSCSNVGCTQKNNVTAHKPDKDDDDCTTAVHCSICNYVTTTAQRAHDFTSAWQMDDAYHWHKCARCNVLSTKVNHSYVEGIPNPVPTYLADGKRIDTCECGKTKEVFLQKLVDSTNPTVAISVNTSSWHSFLNTVTFGLFFKDTQTVTITATDEQSGIKTVEYLLSQTVFNAQNDIIGTWNSLALYNGTASFNVNPKTKQYIYVKVTDYQNNETIINSEGIVIYHDSGIVNPTAEFNMDKQTDIDVVIDLRGNTLKTVKNGDVHLNEGIDYTVSDDKVTIKKEYLVHTLTGSNLILTFAFNPMGVETQEVNVTADFTVIRHIHTPMTDDGNCTTAFVCMACGYQIIAAKTHNWNTTWINDGTSHWQECKNDNCIQKNQEALHSWNPGVVTTKPTYTQEGIKTFTCIICKVTKTEAIEKLPSKESITDFDTGTKIEYEDGSMIDGNVELVVTPKSQMEMKKLNEKVDKVAKGLTLAGLYDIKLLKNGLVIQPDGMIKVTLKLTDEMKAMSHLQVVYIDDNGEMTIIPSEIKDGKIIFITDHFSYYGVIGKVKESTEEPSNPQEPGKDTPQTNDDSSILPIVLLCISTISFCTLMIVSKRNKIMVVKK